MVTSLPDHGAAGSHGAGRDAARGAGTRSRAAARGARGAWRPAGRVTLAKVECQNQGGGSPLLGTDWVSQVKPCLCCRLIPNPPAPAPSPTPAAGLASACGDVAAGSLVAPRPGPGLPRRCRGHAGSVKTSGLFPPGLHPQEGWREGGREAPRIRGPLKWAHWAAHLAHAPRTGSPTSCLLRAHKTQH